VLAKFEIRARHPAQAIRSQASAWIRVGANSAHYTPSRRAIKTGFKYTDMFKTDPDIDSLRSRPDFQALMADISFPSNPFSKGADADR
jgi:hypothetical protein